MMRQYQFQLSMHRIFTTKYDAAFQCDITYEGTSVAKCDKNITTEIDSKSCKSFLQNISIYKKLRYNYTREK